MLAVLQIFFTLLQHRKRSTNDAESSVIPEIRLRFRIFLPKTTKMKTVVQKAAKPALVPENTIIKTEIY